MTLFVTEEWSTLTEDMKMTNSSMDRTLDLMQTTNQMLQ